MTDTFTSPTSDSSSSWLKQRTSIFNNATSQSSTINNTTNQPVVKKVVDKELASLKKIGAVSSVWSNKFVQEDNSGGTTENKKTPTSRNYNITSPPLHPLHTPSDPSLSPRRSNKVNTSPRPNADYIPVTGTRQSFSNINTTQPTSPKSPLFEKVRSLSGTKSMNDDIQQSIDQQKQQSLSGYLSKNSMSSLDLNDIEDNNRSSTVSSSTNGFSSPPLRRSIDTDRTSAKTNVDEAAVLWFQCETLKTQYAQNNARLNKATEDVEFYKRQLEQQGEISRQGIADAVEEKEKEVVRVRQLAELIVKQDKLLNEYQINLDILTQLTNESTYLQKTQAEMNDLRQELISFKKQKEILEGTITALRAELEMSQSQMRLMMAVSTEIQNEFDNYKNKINVEIKDILKQKQAEHETELKAIQEQLVVPATTGRSVSDAKEYQELEALRDQIISLTEALEEKDKTVLDLKSQLKNQKMSMDTQMMELTQSILEKDALLMEFMSSRNNSRETLPQQQQKQQQQQQPRNMITTSVAPVVDTDKYYHPASPEHHQQQQQKQENYLQMSQIRDYMYNTSDEEEEEEEEEEEVQEQLHYTSEGEDEEESNTLQEINHYHQLMTHESSVPQSPADSVSSSISSTISFDSSEEEEKVAEIKHFSYSSVQSQQTRPVSLISSTESLTGGQDMMDDVSRRLSGVSPTSNTSPTNTRFSATKENGANWPMPPPTPPPSEPLPPVPVVPNAGAITTSVAAAPIFTQEKKQEELQVESIIPPPRRARSKTMARDEAPNMSLYTTSIHQSNELPRIIPLQRDLADSNAPVPPPRKDVSTSLDTQQPPHTKWMDDPESEEDDMGCETNTSTVVAAL
ncbi:hypothetical protein INT46_008666 [Mucor plumbeus]|uniref:Uncharacterized protein n=1 Tax=Mucor plumbeus TaxID=97098 RepID=A0A8H7UWB0_9FUNG|nr:hypothetical protein INT46_008666 [Mucor plumbeus]